MAARNSSRMSTPAVSQTATPPRKSVTIIVDNRPDNTTLFQRYHATRSIEDRNAIVMANRGLLGYMATRLLRLWGEPPGISWEEMQSDGVLGLIRAVELYNPGFNRTFANYACWWICGAMIRERHRQRQLRGIIKGAKRPKIISVDMMKAVYKLELATVRAVNHQAYLLEAIAEALDGLTPRQRDILKRLYIQRATAAEVATILGVSCQRIYQIHMAALERLRELLKANPATSGRCCQLATLESEVQPCS